MPRNTAPDVASGTILLQRAEAALKRAKEAGEHYLDYRPEMSRETVRRVVFEHKLRTALEEQQFVLHYQPQIDLATGRIDAAEALLRWRDPVAGPDVARTIPRRFSSPRA